MSLIQHKQILDVRDLAALAQENLGIVQDEKTPPDEKADAVKLLEVLGAALVSFDHPAFFPDTKEKYASFMEEGEEDIWPFTYGEDIAEKWEAMGNNINVTLVADGYVEDYIESLADDFGWFTEETPDFVKYAVDWSQVANTLKSNNDGGKFELDGETYWVGL
jgi:hypothetical protein